MGGTPNTEGSRTHTKVTRDDWINAALAALEGEPIDKLKVLNLARSLGVSRSSFYWYFQNPEEFRSELLTVWEHNTGSIVERSHRSTTSIAAACLGVFECWADPSLYHATLDLAVRDWGRRDAKINARVLEADEARLAALGQMFAAHKFEPAQALVRARLLYHSQVGYYATDTTDPIETRMAYLPHYLQALTGELPSAAEITQFTQFINELGSDASATTPGGAQAK